MLKRKASCPTFLSSCAGVFLIQNHQVRLNRSLLILFSYLRTFFIVVTGVIKLSGALPMIIHSIVLNFITLLDHTLVFKLYLKTAWQPINLFPWYYSGIPCRKHAK
jgi:hypothetical protein